MQSILAVINGPGNDGLTLILMSLAALRIYLEIIGFDFTRLPLTQRIFHHQGNAKARNWHRIGLIFSVGYLVMTAPAVLMGY